MKSISFSLFLLVGFSVSAGWAKSPKSGETEKKAQVINFDDELIEGEIKKPELMYLLQKKQFNFRRLIKLRKNFLPEMNATSEDF